MGLFGSSANGIPYEIREVRETMSPARAARDIVIALFLVVAFFGWLDKAYGDDFSKADYYYQTASTALLLVDYAQTKQIAENPRKWSERNWYLGKNPKVINVQQYFGYAVALNWALARLAPSDFYGWNIRRSFQASVIGVELKVTAGNYFVGLGGRF